MRIELRPLMGDFGAEVIGADPALDVDKATLGEIQAAWRRHGILLFRNLRMTPDDHVAFTRRLGPTHVMTEHAPYNLPDHPEVMVISNVEDGGKPVGLKRAGWGWHSDGEDKAIPNAGSFLYALEVPPAGGDTMYADCTAAFAALPEDVRRTIAGRRACFSRVRLHHVNYPHMPMSEEQRTARPDVWHPIARRHPHTGWTSLYIGRWAIEIEGLPEQEASELIEYLRAFAIAPEFVYRHRWRAGDAILWDNRCTQHCATEFDDVRHRRLMHRTTLEGETPIMADKPVFRPALAATVA